jgi:hypothetical protein
MIAFRVLALLLGFVALASGVEAPQLLLHDIGPFKWIGKPQDAERGYTGILAGSGRLGNPDDSTRHTKYADEERDFGVRVTVSRFADTKWVLHEFIGGLCAGSDLAGEPGRRYFQYTVVGHAGAGGHVAWAADPSTLIRIGFDLAGANRIPELPTEIIDAYLALYPSILDESLLDAPAHCKAWVPEEMRRKLEYAPRDLEFARSIPADSPQAYQRDGFRDKVIDWLTEFAEARERFYGVGSVAELQNELQRWEIADRDPESFKLDIDKNLDRLEAKLTEFQAWWAAHQNDPVQLPTPGATPATSPSPAPTP